MKELALSGRALSFHSLRHSFEDVLKEVDLHDTPVGPCDHGPLVAGRVEELRIGLHADKAGGWDGEGPLSGACAARRYVGNIERVIPQRWKLASMTFAAA